MKRSALLRHLRRHGCFLKREGGSHSLWTNPQTGELEAVPRHNEIPDKLARKICRGLSVTEPGDETGSGSGKTTRTPSPSPSPSPKPSLIVLLGMSGAGKSTVGRILARRLNWSFIDLDEEIVKFAGTTIAEIFRTGGEERFRALERRLTGGLSSERQTVLAPGGGWITNPGARASLAGEARFVWLRVSPEEAVRRILGSGEERPLLAGDDPLAAVRALLAVREPHYGTADVVVDVDARPPEATVNEILVSLGFEADVE